MSIGHTPPDAGAAAALVPVAPPRRRFRWSLLLGLVLVGLPVLVAVLGPLVAPHNPDAPLGPALAGPGTVGPLGTDQLGRDVFSRVLDGGHTTLGIAVASALAAEVCGVLAGVALALSGRAARAVTSYLTRVLLAVPSVLLLSVLVAAFGRSAILLLVGTAIVLTPSLVPIIATKTRTLLGQPWLEASLLAGDPRRTILAREVVPNLAPVIAADLAFRLLAAIFLVSTAGFLGLGPAPPAPDWGVLISDAESTMAQQPWPIIAPAVLLCCLATGITIVSHHFVARATDTREP